MRLDVNVSRGSNEQNIGAELCNWPRSSQVGGLLPEGQGTLSVCSKHCFNCPSDSHPHHPKQRPTLGLVCAVQSLRLTFLLSSELHHTFLMASQLPKTDRIKWPDLQPGFPRPRLLCCHYPPLLNGCGTRPSVDEII